MSDEEILSKIVSEGCAIEITSHTTMASPGDLLILKDRRSKAEVIAREGRLGRAFGATPDQAPVACFNPPMPTCPRYENLKDKEYCIKCGHRKPDRF
jgi:hypothetical protein